MDVYIIRIFQIEKCWFQVNAPDSELKLTIRDKENQQLIDGNSKFFITILIQRVK